jgi:hypothetical protein
MLDVDAVALRLKLFAAEREWDQFHSLKNVAAALVVEAAELLDPSSRHGRVDSTSPNELP